ncbi:uncharacterized protein LOC113361459 isoform X2 [Papaver somniferum]|uniref:uncharacterized protein LOC113361459 isoform X2 n=1 Tax=Papaver somniferum TaxID=3469 RepID=UPI000E6FE6FD|nr:uncharacterized protein LOC113361459 isoform X2 [Papaver somniferum]
MPTGSRTSLTSQLPAHICECVTMVISFLVSLIQDQIMHLLQGMRISELMNRVVAVRPRAQEDHQEHLHLQSPLLHHTYSKLYLEVLTIYSCPAKRKKRTRI